MIVNGSYDSSSIRTRATFATIDWSARRKDDGLRRGITIADATDIVIVLFSAEIYRA